MSGLGRGGRGNALLAALNQPVRKPGQLSRDDGSGRHSGQHSQVKGRSDEAGQLYKNGGAGGESGQSRQYSGEGELELKTASSPHTHLSQQTPIPGAAELLTTSTNGSFPIGRGLRGQVLPQSSVEQVATRPFGRGLRSLVAQQQQIDFPPPQESAAPVTPPLRGRGGLVEKTQPHQSSSPVTTGMKRLSIRDDVSTARNRRDPDSKKGTSGQKSSLSANYLSLQGRSEGVYQYMVTFEPIVESKNHRFGMLSDQHEILGRTRAFDGATLYLPKKITDSSIVLSSIRKTDAAQISITITLVAMVHYAQCLQLFNVIFRRVMRALELTRVGRNYYDPHNPIAIPQHKMELWPGYVSSIQQHDCGLLLMFDVSHRLLRTDTALDFLYELYAANRKNFQDQATKLLVGVVVLTRYNNKTYRIDDIAWDKNPQSTFLNHKGEAICFLDYYKNMYGKVISDQEQPLLIHRPKRRDRHSDVPEEVICLVPELCSMTGLTDMARQDFKIMKDIATYTRIAPSEREVSFKKFVDRVNKCPKAREELESWGLQLNPQMIQLEGRTLNPEKVMFRNVSHSAGPDADWGRMAVKENVISAVPLNNWLVLATKRDGSKAYDFLKMMKSVCPALGIESSDAKMITLPDDRTDTYLQAIRQEINPKLQLVIAIFPTSRDDRYSAFKKLCCVESPVPSQVINARTISQQQKLRSVTQKIALQINCKLGGELWAVEIPVKNMMVIGLDVYHDCAQGKKRSILGFVASSNQYLTRWYSRVVIQGMKQEITDVLRICMQAALKNYYKLNSRLPDRIVMFRDGVGDGQMHTVAEYEVPQVTSCFSELEANYKPKLAVVVVQKRISTRIFQRASPKGLSNPPPGTIVDQTITRKGWYDYFLVSQHVRQGTVTPTHYNVVHDSSELKPDHLQRLTYKLTHMYYNWPGTIRVPAPCQYAHKLAFLVGQSIHRDPALELSNRLFFL